jgi:CBS domain-containing protein
MNMGELCNRVVTIAEPHESVRDVAELMRERHVGCVVLVRGGIDERAPVGIVTDRDIVLGVVAKGLDPAETPIGSVMSAEPFCAWEGEDAHAVLQQMRGRGLRRVPVVDAKGVLQGIFTFDDFVQWTSEQIVELSRLVDREIAQERALKAR